MKIYTKHKSCLSRLESNANCLGYKKCLSLLNQKVDTRKSRAGVKSVSLKLDNHEISSESL